MRRALIAIVVVGCGCGGGKDASGPAPSPPPAPTARPKPQNQVCAPRVRSPDPGPVSPPDDRCTHHAECTARPHGRCVTQPTAEVTHFGQARLVAAHNECIYDDCESDDECRRTWPYEPRAEAVCDCTAERHACAFANCRADSDCPAPATCGPWRYCTSAADTCKTAADCTGGAECRYDWDAKHYRCKVVEEIAPD